MQRLLFSSSTAERLWALRARGRAAFRKHLAIERNPMGVADAMLRELSCSNRSLWGSDARHPLVMKHRSPLLRWDNSSINGLGPVRDVVDQHNVNWSMPGSFEALPYLADRLIIFPREKLVSAFPCCLLWTLPALPLLLLLPPPPPPPPVGPWPRL